MLSVLSLTLCVVEFTSFNFVFSSTHDFAQNYFASYFHRDRKVFLSRHFAFNFSHHDYDRYLASKCEITRDLLAVAAIATCLRQLNYPWDFDVKRCALRQCLFLFEIDQITMHLRIIENGKNDSLTKMYSKAGKKDEKMYLISNTWIKHNAQQL